MNLPAGDSTYYYDSITDPCLFPLDFDPAECLFSTEEQDSLWSAMQKPLPTKRFITDHKTGKVEITPRPLERESTVWQFTFLIVAALILIYIRTVRKFFFRSLRSSVYSRAIFRQLVRDDLLFPFSVRFPLFLVIVITQSVFLMQVIRQFSLFPPVTDPTLELDHLLTIIPLVSGLLIAKFSLHWIFGQLFDTQNITREYLASSFQFNIIAGIFLIPALILQLFSNSMVIMILIFLILLIIILLRIYRGFIISLDLENYSQFQNLLYLCTLEIMPMFIIYRIVTAGMQGLLI